MQDAWNETEDEIDDAGRLKENSMLSMPSGLPTLYRREGVDRGEIPFGKLVN
jgi:hypothetical protein